MISKYHKLKPKDSHTRDHSEFIHDHVIFLWIPRIWPFVLPVYFRSDDSTEESLVWYILKICLKNLKVFWSLFRRRGQAFGFNGTWNSETEILSDDLENNHVSKVTEAITCLNIKWLIYKYQKCSNLSSYVLVCSYEPYPFAQSRTCSILCSASDVWNPLFMRSCRTP